MSHRYRSMLAGHAEISASARRDAAVRDSQPKEAPDA